MHTLFIGDRAYSSWSLRGYLLLEPFGIAHATRLAHFNTPEFEALKREIAPARMVPTLKIEGMAHPVWDSLAIAETLAERHPEAGIWPEDAAARAAARSLAAEMHSGFGALRRECPMNIRRRHIGFRASAEVRQDVARLDEIWRWARGLYGGSGPWLFGRFSAADAFYAPTATRIATYGLEMSGESLAYVETVHRMPEFRRWRAMALASPVVQAHYEMDLEQGPLAGETPPPARPVTGAAAINAKCPYSGKDVAADSLAEIDGRVIGFCNPFCRDKSVADAGAWPKLAPLLA